MTLTATNWFNETISAYSEDYELVCPYYRLGCRVSCRRSTVAKHLRECTFAFEIQPNSIESAVGGDSSALEDYEIVCPNSVLGCMHVGTGRKDIHEHLTVCPYIGQSEEQELKERLLLKQHVIKESEEERVRLVLEYNALMEQRRQSQRSSRKLHQLRLQLPMARWL
jgi:hypothetical protein